MRAVIIGALDDRRAVKIADVEDLVAAPGEVLVEVHACGVNFTDYLSLDGRYQNNPPAPFTPGKDAAGVVVALGQGVVRFAVGDRVIAHVTYGGMAEQAVCDQARCFALPDAVSFADAAGLGLVFMTAYFAVQVRGQLRAADRVLINGGSGGVGLAAIGMAKGLGARQVLAGLATPAKAEAAKAAGADGVIDLSVPDLKIALGEQLNDATAGAGVDLVIDLLGGEYFDAALRSVNKYGRVVVTGFASGTIATVRTNHLLLRNISVIGMTLQTFLDEHSDELADAQSKTFELLAAGRISSNVTARYPFEAFMKPIERIEQRQVIGKSVLMVRGE
jgi:NADPH2:quinone reductase